MIERTPRGTCWTTEDRHLCYIVLYELNGTVCFVFTQDGVVRWQSTIVMSDERQL